MIDFEKMYPTARLKGVSLSAIQDAISEALLKLVSENDPTHRLHVSITSLEFLGSFGSRAKMALTLDSHSDEAFGESSKDQAASPSASH